MDFVEHALCIGTLCLSLGAERIHEAFVLASGEQAAFDAHFVHQPGKAKPVHQHANAAHNAGLVHVDVVRRCGNVISRRRAGLLHHGVHRLLVQCLQAVDLVIDHAGLHRAAARGVNQQHHCLGAAVLKRRTQRIHDRAGVGIRLGTDFATHLDQSGVRTADRGGWSHVAVGQPQDSHKQRQPEQPDGHLPTPGSALFLQRGESELFQRGALPARCGLLWGLGRLRHVLHMCALQKAMGCRLYCDRQNTTPSCSTASIFTSGPRPGPPTQRPVSG